MSRKKLQKDWETKTLAEVCEVLTDGNWIESKDQSPEGIRLIQTGNIGEGVFKERKSKARYISEKTFKNLNCTEIFEGDCLISRLPEPVGRACLLPKLKGRAITAVDCSILRFKKDFYPKFFIYYSLSQKYLSEVEKQCTGATRKRVSRKNIGKVDIPYPSLPEQKRIVKILDEKFAGIDELKKITEQQIVDAKELFESRLEDIYTEMARDPLVSIDYLVENNFLNKPLDGNHGETHPKASDYVKTGVPFIMASDLKNGRVDQESCNFISKKQADSLRKGFAINDDVLLSHKGTVGRVAVLRTKLEYVMLTPQVTYYRITDPKKLFNKYLYFVFQSKSFQNQLNYYALEGSTRAYIGITKQLNLKIPLDSIERQRQIAEELEELSAKTKELEAIFRRKIADLEELKKSYLQQAFSGKL